MIVFYYGNSKSDFFSHGNNIQGIVYIEIYDESSFIEVVSA